MPVMTGITNALDPLIAEELNNNDFEINSGQVRLRAGIVVLSTDSVSYVVAPEDKVIVINNGSTLLKELVFPASLSVTGREITVRMPIAMSGREVTVKTAAGNELTLPGTELNSATNEYNSVVMADRAVLEATWLATGARWKLTNWTVRAFYATAGYSAPANATTFNGSGGVQPAAGVPYQIPAGSTSWLVTDGNYTPLIKLPAGNNATGRYSVYAANSASFDTYIDRSGTDLPVNTRVYAPAQSIHFEWSNGLWRWCPAPESASGLSAVIGVGATATRSLNGTPLTPVTSAIGTLIGFMFPAA
jgi:hypothetical protein